ncbi:titin-like [Diachasmimorpha longicaudata]
MNKEKIDNSMKIGEIGVTDDSKTAPKIVKKDSTNGPEINEIVDDGLSKTEGLKGEENGTSLKDGVGPPPETPKEQGENPVVSETEVSEVPASEKSIPSSEEPVSKKSPEKLESSPGKSPLGLQDDVNANPEEGKLTSEGTEDPQAPNVSTDDKEDSTDESAEKKSEEKAEVIQMIEEIIVMPVEESKKSDCNEVECPEPSLTPPDSSPAEGPENGSLSPQDESPPEAGKPEPPEPKKRSVIEFIYEDWSDGNVEEEEAPSSKVDDTVENQLKSLLEEKVPKTTRRTPSPKVLPPEKTPELLSKSITDSKNPGLKKEEKKTGKTVVEASSDSKELLAILEGDIEPDWSDLKPPTLLIECSSDQNSKSESEQNPPKLDPLIERQLALKQLLELPMNSKKPRISPRKSPVVPKQILEEDETVEEFKVDESRSGRKRKPTEKAREHEITAKRQKVIKVKAPGEKAPVKKVETVPQEKIKEKSSDETKGDVEIPKKTAKDAKSVSAAKKIIRKIPQKPSSIVRPPRKSRKSAGGSLEGAPKRKKTVNEIDRLLQDEGVVNLLYDVEQPGKRRLVPVTKSQAKVMDIQKVQRELRIRTKLVKNAVLRLRTSAGPGPNAPRAKRISAGSCSLEEQESPTVTPTQSSTPGEEFLIPAKIRNAADASIIVRRHSSSSFSSASGSPRVSIDSNDRQVSYDEGKSQGHAMKAGKRSPPQGGRKKVEGKKAKKVLDPKLGENIAPKSRGKSPAGKAKPVDRKKILIRKALMMDNDGDDKTLKVVKSNGTAGKITTPKKSPKSKVKFAKNAHLDGTSVNEPEGVLLDGLSVSHDAEQDEDDKLSACLAAAVTALANDTASRGKNCVLNRKGKTREQRGKDSKVQFSNKEINVQRHANLVQLILTPSTTSKIRNGITLQMMQEFREVLSVLKKDDSCRVVLLTSTGSSFCEGLELSSLLEENKDVRRANAQLLADGVKDFIKSLATFNKPIVAGVQGSAVGLGVTMLPLFDLVIASDKASFSTPYGKLGQIAEGAAVFTLSHVLGSAVTSELLLGGRTLTANEALRAGLVTRVLWPDRFHVELLPSLRAMSEQSSQSMEATKALLRHSLRSKLSAALESESYLLVQHWCSTECQNAIRAYMDEKRRMWQSGKLVINEC